MEGIKKDLLPYRIKVGGDIERLSFSISITGVNLKYRQVSCFFHLKTLGGSSPQQDKGPGDLCYEKSLFPMVCSYR